MRQAADGQRMPALSWRLRQRPPSEQSIRVQLVVAIRPAFSSKDTDRIASEDLTAVLVDLEDRSWAEWKNGKPMTKAQLARLLKPFDIVSDSVRIAADKTLRDTTEASSMMPLGAIPPFKTEQ